jgi:hypothetical protein
LGDTRVYTKAYVPPSRSLEKQVKEAQENKRTDNQQETRKINWKLYVRNVVEVPTPRRIPYSIKVRMWNEQAKPKEYVHAV